MIALRPLKSGHASATRRRDIRLAYLLLSPALLLLLIVLGYPVGWEIWTSLTDLSPLKDLAWIQRSDTQPEMARRPL